MCTIYQIKVVIQTKSDSQVHPRYTGLHKLCKSWGISQQEDFYRSKFVVDSGGLRNPS